MRGGKETKSAPSVPPLRTPAFFSNSPTPTPIEDVSGNSPTPIDDASGNSPTSIPIENDSGSPSNMEYEQNLLENPSDETSSEQQVETSDASEQEPRPRRERRPPRWMSDPNWICYSHTVPVFNCVPFYSYLFRVFVPCVYLVPLPPPPF